MAEFQDYLTNTSLPEINARLAVLNQQLNDIQALLTPIVTEVTLLNTIKTQLEAYLTP